MNRILCRSSILFLAVSFQLWPLIGLVFAETGGNPHSLYIQGYLYMSEEQRDPNLQCIQCHVSPTDERPLIWQMVPESIKKYGARGILCASCHDGISMVDRYVDGGRTVFNPESHGFDSEKAPIHTDLDNSGLPYTPGDFMSCSTCHEAHMPKNRPYLNVPIQGICQRCHQNREHQGFGIQNLTGSHPVDIEPFDDTGGPSPILVDEEFLVPFPDPYPSANAYFSSEGHWTLGGHLTYGSYGRVECSTCHSFHGVENKGPFQYLLSKDPVKIVSNEFCEGCHKGVRGDEKKEPPYPNPGGTITGRTYHPVDDDESNGAGWNMAIADTIQRSYYEWGEIDSDTDRPVLICTTCHVAHNGMENSPALIQIAEETKNEGVNTHCEICHRDPPEGHHAYADTIIFADSISEALRSNIQNLGTTYGELTIGKLYCSYCHMAHNAGFGKIEANYIPLLVDGSMDICINCHNLGVSHFLGDPTLSSTYGDAEPPVYRDMWLATGLHSKYGGTEENSSIIICESCHYLANSVSGEESSLYRLLAPADEGADWLPGYPEDYLCTGCHGEAPATVGGGQTHPLIEADGLRYPVIPRQLGTGETPVSYTDYDGVNCHSCHRAHRADLEGGLYILKIGSGTNNNPKAIRPQVMYTELCRSCHDN